MLFRQGNRDELNFFVLLAHLKNIRPLRLQYLRTITVFDLAFDTRDCVEVESRCQLRS